MRFERDCFVVQLISLIVVVVVVAAAVVVVVVVVVVEIGDEVLLKLFTLF